MKTYFRLLSFAKPIEKFAIPYVLITIIAVTFSTVNLGLLIPLLNALFIDSSKGIIITPKPEFSISFEYFVDTFNHHFYTIIKENGQSGALIFVCILVVVTNFIANISSYSAQRIMENLKIRTLLNLRKTAFNRVMKMHVGFFSNEKKGDIISKISSDVQVVQFTVTATLQVLFKEPLQLIAYIIFLVYLSPQLTLFSLCVIPVAGIIISRIVKSLKSKATAAQETFGTMISFLDEALSSIKVIKASNAYDFVTKRFNNQNVKYSNITRSMTQRQQLASPTSQFLGVCTIAFILYYGGTLIFNKQSDLSPSEFIAYIAVFSQVMRPAKAFTEAFTNIHNGIAAGERVLTLIDTPVKVADKADATTTPEFSDSIIFRNVSFGYLENTPILKDLNFSIKKGQTVALVGPSGGGKSTISDLIPRFYDVNEGEILFDGVDIRTLKIDSIRSQIGMVGQESILFNDTIFNNISFGIENPDKNKVIEAAKIANAHNFIIETNEGYETNIGDRGMKLSGGQKQRLNIARAVLRNPPILILDEATSALDTESEKLVQDALNNLMQNRTALIIAHRLSTIQNADVILVLDAGKIIEQGTHKELLEKNGFYKKLIDMQTFS